MIPSVGQRWKETISGAVVEIISVDLSFVTVKIVTTGKRTLADGGYWPERFDEHQTMSGEYFEYLPGQDRSKETNHDT